MVDNTVQLWRQIQSYNLQVTADSGIVDDAVDAVIH